MGQERKLKLVALGAKILADALLDLAVRVDAADDLIKQLIATPQENVQRYKAKLASLKRRERFVSWRESTAYAHELEMLLADLRSGVDEPKLGVEFLASFYEADAAVFDQCDDSSGNVGDVFRYDAKQLFVSYAARCEDKDWLVNLVFDLNKDDGYGVRGILVDCAAEYLPESAMRKLIERFLDAAKREGDEYQKRHWMFRVESLARQIKDAPLFEQTRLASWGLPSTAACVDIARVYLESGDAKKALSWLERISADEIYQAHERDQLLLQIYGKFQDRDKQAEVALRIFRRHRSKDALQTLLSVIGIGQKNAVVENEVDSISQEATLSDGNAMFLIEMGRLDVAETYLLDRIDQLNGDYYSELLPLAEAMETAGRRLCAYIIYRALLNSILSRGQTKTYTYGARYLKKLDSISKSISDWRNIVNHTIYMDDLRQKHGRKRSFWSRYDA